MELSQLRNFHIKVIYELQPTLDKLHVLVRG